MRVTITVLAQGAASPGLHGRDKISDMDVAVEFGLIVARELALLR
jgi:hypothetical protein